MRLSLFPTEFDRLTALVEALHAPFDFPDVDAWRHVVNHHARLLLDAHKVVFMLPGAGHAPAYCQRLDPAGFEQYVSYYSQFDVAGAIALRRSLPVSSLLEIHGREEFYASEYYNDFMRVWKCNHSVGMVTPIEEEPGYAYIGVLRDDYEDPPFNARERALLRFILPAFRAGVHTYQRLAAERALLASVLDASDKRLLVCDRSGKPVHASSALERTLAADPERQGIEREIQSLARATAGLAANGNTAIHSVARAGQRVVSTLRGHYRLSASLAGEGRPEPVGVLVLLEPLFPDPLADPEVRERYGLTTQELRVARLIAIGLRNEAIARRLHISPHTARRHTEHILEKLGIASRAQVADRITRT